MSSSLLNTSAANAEASRLPIRPATAPSEFHNYGALWDRDRITRFMPLVEPGVRRVKLKLPLQIVELHTGRPTNQYTLLHYFEIYRSGDRHYSQIYTELIETAAPETARQVTQSCFLHLAGRRSWNRLE